MTRGARKEGLSRRHRFVGRGGFSVALRSPRKLRGSRSILHVATGRTGESRLGISLPKKMAPRSVDRNRLKRLAREIFRRHGVKLAGHDLVFTVRQRFEAPSEREWVEEFRQLLDRAGTPG